MSKILPFRALSASEEQVQRALAEYLAWNLKPGVCWTHMPSGGMRDRVAGAKLKAMGHHAGWPDLQFVYCGTILFLELKTDRGRVSDAQLAVHQALRAQGVTVRVAAGLDDALAIIDEWGLFRRPVREYMARKAGDTS